MRLQTRSTTLATATEAAAKLGFYLSQSFLIFSNKARHDSLILVYILIGSYQCKTSFPADTLIMCVGGGGLKQITNVNQITCLLRASFLLWSMLVLLTLTTGSDRAGRTKVEFQSCFKLTDQNQRVQITFCDSTSVHLRPAGLHNSQSLHTLAGDASLYIQRDTGVTY